MHAGRQPADDDPAPADPPGFQAPLPVDLTPLTGGTAIKTATDGFFRPTQGQIDAGAFGLNGVAQLH